MKIVRLIAAVALLTTVAILSVSAQQPKPGATAPPAAAPQSNVAVPDSKLALIYSEAFMDPKNGIARFGNLLNTLTREFQPRQTELTSLGQKIDQLRAAVDASRNADRPLVVPPHLVEALSEEPALREYHLLPSVRADLLEKLGRTEEAGMEFERAASLAQNARERELLLSRARACGRIVLTNLSPESFSNSGRKRCEHKR